MFWLIITLLVVGLIAGAIALLLVPGRDRIGFRGTLAQVGALSGSSDHSTTKSLYGHDPDGLEFEIAWIVPADRLDVAALAGRSRIQPLDLAREIARYGADTPGGFGISRAAVPTAG